MAHKKAGGSSRNGRDSAGRRLGVKLYGGQAAFATAEGNVTFHKGLKGRTFISVLPAAEAAE